MRLRQSVLRARSFDTERGAHKIATEMIRCWRLCWWALEPILCNQPALTFRRLVALTAGGGTGLAGARPMALL